jgi:hypothetical protein
MDSVSVTLFIVCASVAIGLQYYGFGGFLSVPIGILLLALFRDYHIRTHTLVDYDPNKYKDDTDLELRPWKYANFGLYQSLADLQAMDLKDLARMPIAEQAKYSDAISRRYAKNQKFLDLQIADVDAKSTVQNVGSIGNLAVIALHNPGSEWAEIHAQVCRDILSQSNQ